MPPRRARERLRELQVDLEESLLVRDRLQPRVPEGRPDPGARDLVAREPARHVAQVVPWRVVLARARDAPLLEHPSLQEKLACDAVASVRQDLERVEQPEPTFS